MSLIERSLQILKNRAEVIKSGGINAILSPFKRFRTDFVGIEQGTYYCVTSATKGGKSQFSSFMFIYAPLLYAYNHPEQVTVNIKYFPLEETPEGILHRFMSYLLYIYDKIEISPADLRSTNNEKPIPENVLNLLDTPKYTSILKYFEEHVEFSTNANPTGIFKECRLWAESTGKITTKTVTVKNDFGDLEKVEAFDYYTPNNPKEYKIIFLDHISLLHTEGGKNLRETIQKMSEYFVLLRNRYKMTPVVIQQQAFFENVAATQANLLKPELVNLADCKYTARDIDICLGLFSPYKHNLPMYMGYNITKFRDKIRFLEVLANRNGISNGTIALYFNGASCFFQELPRPEDSLIEKWYKFIEQKIFLFIHKLT